MTTETYYCPRCGRDYVDAAPEEIALWTSRHYCCDYCLEDNPLSSVRVELTLDEVLEYATQRFIEGSHLAESLLDEAKAGQDPAQLASDSARRGAYLSAYFADCIMRLAGGEHYG